LELQWKHVDLAAGELRLPDSKSGARLVPLSPAAAQVLTRLPRIKGSPWVIPGTKPGRHLPDLNHYWERVRERADLDGVRLHDLRHSFASRALALGESLSMIGKLLGHNKIDTVTCS
ncbi:MAG: site-specific integrase, partial [Chloroflexi bacterium]|nr:site-specific integrase [Chloroflexota bacterium]